MYSLNAPANGSPAPFALMGPESLERLAQWGAERYASADPFPHLVIDDLFNPNALNAVLAEWPFDVTEVTETHNDGTYVKLKRSTHWRSPIGPTTERYLAAFNSPGFLEALQQVTGISGLVPDPYFFGGGLHQTSAGGRLAIHADYNRHPVLKLRRRLNVLVYLNHGWTPDHGGELELWTQDMRACVVRVAPVFNRTVIFNTDSTSYHGQPNPVVGPARRSIALYYFTADPPGEAPLAEHSTLWRERPGEGF